MRRLGELEIVGQCVIATGRLGQMSATRASLKYAASPPGEETGRVGKESGTIGLAPILSAKSIAEGAATVWTKNLPYTP